MKCWVPHCKNVYKKGSKMSFYSIPNDDRKLVWLQNIRKTDLSIKDARICQIHFEAKHFKNSARNRIYNTAIPTLHLQRSKDAATSENEECNDLDVSSTDTARTEPNNPNQSKEAKFRVISTRTISSGKITTESPSISNEGNNTQCVSEDSNNLHDANDFKENRRKS